MAIITIAMRHSQGVTLQYVALTMAEKAVITTRLAIEAYKMDLEGGLKNGLTELKKNKLNGRGTIT